MDFMKVFLGHLEAPDSILGKTKITYVFVFLPVSNILHVCQRCARGCLGSSAAVTPSFDVWCCTAVQLRMINTRKGLGPGACFPKSVLANQERDLI